MRTIGLIGGTSWHSTVEYYSTINQMINDIKGDRINPPLRLLNLSQKEINDFQAEGNWDAITRIYIEASQDLIRAGAEAILFCSNTAHHVYDAVSAKIEVPILHIADATGKEAKKNNLNKLGLLGTVYTMDESYIKGRLSKEFNLQTITPDKSAYKELARIIYDELAIGSITAASKTFVISEMEKLKNQGAEGIILGCTEFPLLVKSSDYDLTLFDTTYLHCKMATDFIVEQ